MIYLILHLIEFLLREVITTLSHLDHFLVLVDESLELLYINFVS